MNLFYSASSSASSKYQSQNKSSSASSSRSPSSSKHQSESNPHGSRRWSLTGRLVRNLAYTKDVGKGGSRRGGKDFESEFRRSISTGKLLNPGVPHTLPLPELGALLRRDIPSFQSNTCSYFPLPSPQQPPSRGGGGGDRERSGGLNGDGLTPKSAGFGRVRTRRKSRKTKDDKDTRQSSRSPKAYQCIHASAPNSPYSSPARSPISKDMYNSPDWGYKGQLWFAPEMAPTDITSPCSSPTRSPISKDMYKSHDWGYRGQLWSTPEMAPTDITSPCSSPAKDMYKSHD